MSKSGGQPTIPIDKQEELEAETRARWESYRASYNAWAVEEGEFLSTFDEIVEGQVALARVQYQKARASSELDQASVLWDQVTAEDAAALQELLDRDPDESEMHCFLDDNPKFLIQVLGGGHGRYQLSKQRLGSEFVPDFLVAQMSSIGIDWHAVEIESPRKKVHTKRGDASAVLNQAINQIRDWRSWLMNNINYARNPEGQNGLGLVGIDHRVPGLILVGRRHEYHERYNEFRRQVSFESKIVIHSYDWLVDVARCNSSGWLTRELSQ